LRDAAFGIVGVVVEAVVDHVAGPIVSVVSVIDSRSIRINEGRGRSVTDKD
jgi:hypothetical protein